MRYIIITVSIAILIILCASLHSAENAPLKSSVGVYFTDLKQVVDKISNEIKNDSSPDKLLHTIWSLNRMDQMEAEFLVSLIGLTIKMESKKDVGHVADLYIAKETKQIVLIDDQIKMLKSFRRLMNSAYKISLVDGLIKAKEEYMERFKVANAQSTDSTGE